MRRQTLVWAYGAGQLLAIAAACAANEWSSNMWIDMAAQVVLASQFNLAGIWVALGRRRAPWRLVAIGALLTSLTWLTRGSFELRITIFVFTPAVPATLAALIFLQSLGYRLGRCENVPGAAESSRLQFSIRSLLEWTAATAILFSLASLISPDYRVNVQGFITLKEALILIVPLHLLFLGICLSELAIVLCTQRPGLGLALLSLAALVPAGLIGWSQSEIVNMLWLTACLVIWFAMSFVPLRLLGYRFGRRRALAGEAALNAIDEEDAVARTGLQADGVTAKERGTE